MPYPRLSPALNNCAMHALTPEICAQVHLYAGNHAYDNQHNPEYLRLKAVFAEFYGYDDADRFTWTMFSDTLNFYNAFDVQLVLGPVLRLFMKGSMVADAETADSFIQLTALADDVSVEDYINGYTQISVALNGRYRTIAPDELAKYVGNPLGLSIRYHPQEGDIREHLAEPQVAQVCIHHLGDVEGIASGHWERAPDITSADCVDYQPQESTKLACILPLLGNEQITSQCGIKLLQDHVALVAPGLDGPDTIHLTSAQITKYSSVINFVPKKLAIKLLGDPLTEDTERFIETYQILAPVPPMQIVENYLRVPKDCRPQVKPEEMTVITRLLSGLSPQQKDALTDRKFYASLAKAARERVQGAVTSIRRLPVDFSAVDDGDAIDALERRLIETVIRRFNAPEEDLRILGQLREGYQHLVAASEDKEKEIQRAAFRRKRERLLIEIGFDGYFERFSEQATAMEASVEVDPELDDPAATAARNFVGALTRAKDRFLREEEITMEEYKRNLKEACELAVNEARPLLRGHRGWLGTMAKFLTDVVSLLSQAITENRWTMFYATPEEILDGFEAEVVNNPLLVRGG